MCEQCLNRPRIWKRAEAHIEFVGVHKVVRLNNFVHNSMNS